MTTLIARALRGAALLALLAAGPAAAQVGYPPSRSPYRELTRGFFITPMVSRLGGNGGRLEIGPQDGTLYGVGLHVRSNKFVGLGLELSRGTVQRRVLDPFVVLAERDQGLFDQTLTLAAAQVALNLTGGKSWRRLAPFVTLGGGFAFAGDVAADTSGYDFGSRLFLAPSVGVKVHLAQRLQLRLEAKAAFWKVPYPDSYRREPIEEPGTIDAPNAVVPDGRLDEWTASGLLSAGLSWSP